MLPLSRPQQGRVEETDSGEWSIMPTGSVKWFNQMKGFGFIEPDAGGSDVFVHVTAVQQAGLTTLAEGQRVEFDMAPGKDGRENAANLKPLEAAADQGAPTNQDGQGTSGDNPEG